LDTPDPDPSASLIALIINLSSTGFSTGIAISIFVLLLLLVLSALVSGSETAYFSLKPADVNLLEALDSETDRLVLSLRDHPKTLLATILIANNLLNVAIVILSGFITENLFQIADNPLIGFLIQIVAITSLILLVGEIIPKVVANKHPLKVASIMARPLGILIGIFKPLSYMLVASSTFIDRRLSRKLRGISISELSDAIDITSDDTALPEEKQMLKGIATFSEKDARSIMKSRVNITAIDIETSFENLLELILNTGFSRIPVYEDNLDKVLGILYIKDLLPYLNQTELEWKTLVRSAFFVPENKKINDLLQEFREKKIHMAIVVDEYGGTSGLLTLEDIIEEIVGDISDEFDKEPDDNFYQRLDEHNILFDASTSLLDFCKVMELDEHYFEDVQGESDTLAGLLLELEGRIPEQGLKVSCKDYAFEVTDADTRRIKKLNVSKRSENEA
jgi:gliding motility-associated protein GldE